MRQWATAALLLGCGLAASGCSDSDGEMRAQPSFQALEAPRRHSPSDSIPSESRSHVVGAVEPSEARLRQGMRLFAINCSHCHGASGRGDGPVAAKLKASPRNLQSTIVQVKPAPVLYAIITNGMGAMPGFAGELSAEQRWALAHYVGVLDERPADGGDGGQTE